jgi:hypothetical protein
LSRDCRLRTKCQSIRKRISASTLMTAHRPTYLHK